MTVLFIILGTFFLLILTGFCIQKGRQKKIGTIGVVAIMILCTPFIGYFIVEALPNNKRPCKWCGNKLNEAAYCGLCKKNEAGEMRPGFYDSSADI